MAWLEPVTGASGLWLEVAGGTRTICATPRPMVLPLVAALLEAERQRAYVAEELASRYEEIDLLYAISEILGRTVRLEEAAQIIVREVSAVVGARRASIMVYDETSGLLRTVAARGFAPRGWPGAGGRRLLGRGPGLPRAANRHLRPVRPGRRVPSECGEPAATAGTPSSACRSAMPRPAPRLRCVGVINLTDRIGGDRFTPDDRKLVTAVANQIGAAVENARLVERDAQQQRLQRELELAHDLQLKLLPSPAVLQGDAEVAARCLPADRWAATSTPSAGWAGAGWA